MGGFGGVIFILFIIIIINCIRHHHRTVRGGSDFLSSGIWSSASSTFHIAVGACVVAVGRIAPVGVGFGHCSGIAEVSAGIAGCLWVDRQDQVPSDSSGAGSFVGLAGLDGSICCKWVSWFGQVVQGYPFAGLASVAPDFLLGLQDRQDVGLIGVDLADFSQ